MKAEEFSVWFSGVGRLSVEQRREVAAALANLDGGLRRAGETETSAAGGATGKGAKRVRTLWGRAAMSEWRAKAVRIAQDERSSPGDARMGFRGSAARAAGAPSMRSPRRRWRICTKGSVGSTTLGR